MTEVSKTFSGSSILSSPVIKALRCLKLRRSALFVGDKMSVINSHRFVKHIFAFILVVLLVIVCCFYYFSHNKSYKNEAFSKGEDIYLNGVKYLQISDINDYSITNIKICTTDTGIKLYEIKEYPDYEYIAGDSVWDGSIYKRDDE